MTNKERYKIETRMEKQNKEYEKVEFNKYFAPFILFSFCVLVFMIINFQNVSYRLNESSFEEITGRISKIGVDGLFNVIETYEISYNYGEKEYTYSWYNIYKFSEGEEVPIRVNKKAPTYIFIIKPNRIAWLSKYLVLGGLISVIVLIRTIYYRFRYTHYIRVEDKKRSLYKKHKRMEKKKRKKEEKAIKKAKKRERKEEKKRNKEENKGKTTDRRKVMKNPERP